MAAPFSTVGGYGGSSTVILDPASGLTTQLVDTQDGFPVLHPAINPSGGLVPFAIDPVPLPPFGGMPELNAVLVELRVIAALLREQMGPQAPDLQIMRADEAWNTSWPNPTATTVTPATVFPL